MPKQTKTEKAKEDIFSQKVAPLMDKIAEVCDEHNFPLLVAVQLYVNKTDGARIAAQSVETRASVLPFKISSKLLRGEARVTSDSDSSFYVSIADDEGNFSSSLNSTLFDESQLETLQEHSAHCDDCREQVLERLAQGEDISNIRIIGDHISSADNFTVDETTLPMMGGFFSPKIHIVH